MTNSNQGKEKMCSLYMSQSIWEGLVGTVARNLRQELKQRQEPYLLPFFL